MSDIFASAGVSGTINAALNASRNFGSNPNGILASAKANSGGFFKSLPPPKIGISSNSRALMDQQAGNAATIFLDLQAQAQSVDTLATQINALRSRNEGRNPFAFSFQAQEQLQELSSARDEANRLTEEANAINGTNVDETA